MKSLLIYSFLFVIFINTASAQQARTTDDALLLEYYQTQHFDNALTYLKNIYQEPVTNTTELLRLAYTASMAGKLPDAEDFYLRIYDKDSTNQAVLYNLAGINRRRENNAKAELYYKKIIAADTANFNAYNQLAQISQGKNDIKNAVNYFQRANNINPADGDVAADLSSLYIKLKQFIKAEKVLNMAIVADPENIVLQQNLLKLNYSQNKWAAAVKTGEQLLLLRDSTTSTVAMLGAAYYNTKSYACGIAVLSALTDLLQNETTCYYTAVCYKQLKDQKNAILYLNKAILLSISPNAATYYNEMADSYETIKQFNKAQGAYQKGLLYEEKTITYYFMATLYDTELKDKKTALKYYKKYLASKPDEKEQTYIAYSTGRITALSSH